MADIEIRMLGKFEILMDGKPVLAALKQSRKATMLIQYLVLQKGEKVTHKDLTDTLWNGERSTNPDMALRAIMHRFRNMIEAEGLKELETCIITSRGYYQWNPTMECRVDVFEMEALMEEARRQLNPAAAVARYERVLELNRNDQMVDVLSFEGWLEPNEMSLLSAILEPGIPAGEHRGELQEYINTIRMQRVKDGTITQAGEDPLLTFGRIKKQNAGGQTI